MPRLGRIAILMLMWGLIVTCARITVNIYFPAAEIQDAATQIEQEVRQEEMAPGESTPTEPTVPAPRQPSSGLWPYRWRVRLSLAVPEAHAQKININRKTPAIRRLIEARKKRFRQLVPLFNAGALGENNRGLVNIRSLKSLSLKDKARAKTLRQQENRDRQSLYQELGKANKIPANKVKDIAIIFAKVNRKEARSGWWLQEPDGNWRKK